MKFSFVIPIYKVEKYLSDCIESILCQTFKDYEIILVDDGSPDGCPVICDEYASSDSRIKVVHQTNSGVACARNNGIERAQGEYVFCIDGDDFLSNPDILEDLSLIIAERPDVVLLGYKKFFDSSNTYSQEYLPAINSLTSLPQMLQAEFQNNTYGGTAWTKLVKASLLKDNGISFRPGMVGFEDSDWFINVMLSAKTYTGYQRSVVSYRQRAGSISHTPIIQSVSDGLWLLETWPKKIKQSSSNNETEKALMQVMAYYYANIMILFSLHPYKISRPFKKQLSSHCCLLDYASTPRAIIIRKCYKILGFDVCILLLKILNMLKSSQ